MDDPAPENERVRRIVLLHLLEHRGQQVRFEASQWTTEFGILRRFTQEDPAELRNALRSLEMARMVYQRTQYVVGYSEPKNVFSLTPTGHRQALEYRREAAGLPSNGTGNGPSTTEAEASYDRARVAGPTS